MQIIKIFNEEVADNSYDIIIDTSALNILLKELKKTPFGNKYAIITDDTIKQIHGESLLNTMKKEGLDCVLLSFKSGEQSKNMQTFEYLHENLLEKCIDRKSCIIALGGGVVGDIAGFVAGTYMRGINYIQIPTTLLAQVDSSIGGKTAIDLKNSKNMCGIFYQPKRVYIDVSLLKTLPKKEIINGLVEIIKHAIISDEDFFVFLETNIKDILSRENNLLIRTIQKSCEIKAEIVMNDPHEENLRRILNYGHTIAHALETLTGYKKYTHGEAVAIGMAVEGRISNLMGWLKEDELSRQNKLLEKTGANLTPPKIDIDLIIKELSRDKKAISGKVYFALPEHIGVMKCIDGSYGITVPVNIVRNALREFV